MSATSAATRVHPVRGIPEADRAYLYSADVESYLLPITMRMGRGDEMATIQRLRCEFRVIYGDYAERVLAFCLRNYQHANGEGPPHDGRRTGWGARRQGCR